MVFLAVLILLAFTSASKKKQVVPEYLLNAQTVYVVIMLDTGRQQRSRELMVPFWRT
jgi:hypothetical protein